MTSPLFEDALGAPQDSAGASDVLDATKPKQAESLGPLLDEQDDKKVAEAVVEMLRGDAANRRRRRAEWECNRLWLRGVRGARVRRTSEDRNSVELVVPLGASDLPPVMDRADELLEKVVSQLIADPAIPDAEPATDSAEDRDAAEFTTRLLTVEGSESGYNNQAVIRKSLRKAGVYGSGFVYASVDPQGNGWRPMEIRALPEAMTTEDATLDPETGQMVGDSDPRLTMRYVAPDQSLTDDPSQADRQWLPKIQAEIMTGEQVVLLPYSCSGIGDAQGCVLIRWTPLDKLRTTFKEKLGDLHDEAVLQKLVEWRPEDSKYAKPAIMSGKEAHNAQSDGTKVKETALICTLSFYHKSDGLYPKGAYVCVAGGDMVLHKRPWSGVVESGPNEVREECLIVPLAQFRQFDDDIDDDPYGYGVVRKIGPADEVRGDIVLGWMEYLEKFLHPIPFIPMGSNVQPDQLAARDDTAVFFNPAGEPKFEKIEPFPADAKEFFDRATQSQDSATLLEEAAQGVDTKTATSGIAKQIVVQQAHLNMATLRTNTADGQERLWRIVTQLFRVFYTVPMQMKYQGEDGSYKQREWSRSDLGSTRDIKIARGSFTQQSPEQKQLTLDNRYAQGLLDPEEYDRLSQSNIRPRIGFQDNPHRLRVRKQLSAWRDGPPQDWAPQGPQIDPMTGQEMPAMDPASPFADVRSVDAEQDVARVRHLELRREMASSSYLKWPPEWRMLLDQEYNVARQAAGVSTLAEQQMQMQQEQQMQADQQMQAEGMKMQGRQKETQMKMDATREQSESERAFEAQMSEADRRSQEAQAALKSQGAPVP